MLKIDCAFDEMVLLEKLIPNPKNPNKHPENQIELLAKIIRTQGMRAPIVVSKRSGFVIKGHGRLAALQKLNELQAPVDYQDYENEAQEWGDMIADNRIAELSFRDNGMVKDVLNDLDALNFDLELTGYDLPTIETLMTNVPEPNLEDFMDADEVKSKFFTCPHCEKEFEEKQAMVRVE
jgi:hypothetical protein